MGVFHAISSTLLFAQRFGLTIYTSTKNYQRVFVSRDEACYDTVWTVFNNIYEDFLNNETNKVLLELKDTVVIKYIVEIYINSLRDMSIEVVVGPPYIHIRGPRSKYFYHFKP